MADWEANWSRDALERIVVLLFALANLADLAADAPFLRRRQVLGIVGYGEAEARAFVTGMVFGETAPADAPAPAESPEQTGDAARLAVRLRALALALCVLMARRFTLSGAAGPRAGRRKPAERIGLLAAAQAPDTS